MPSFMDMFNQAKQLQAYIQEALDVIDVESEVGGGLVKVRMDGKKRMTAIRIDPSLLEPDQAEELETLILSAVQEAVEKVEAEVRNRIGNILPPGINLPGF